MDVDTQDAPPDYESNDVRLKQSDKVWFADGNLVLSGASHKPNELVLFRVHKSVLAKYSRVFEDMLSLSDDAASEDASERYDGVPLVAMTDTSDELRTMLEMLYDPLCALFDFSPRC